MSQSPDRPSAPGFDINELPEWARAVVQGEKPSTPRPALDVSQFAGGSSWPALVCAATVSSFLPRDLVTEADLDEAHRKDAEQSVLSFAEEVHEPDGTK